MSKKRYVLVGAGGRAVNFIEPLVTTYRDAGELVALCDLSATRMAVYNERLQKEWSHPAVPAYLAADFDRMLRETKPDEVIVCTVDATHHDYIVRALRAGCDVVTEKPMTTDEAKCRAIFDAVVDTGRHVRVAFNYRWGSYRTKVKELIATGAIGQVQSVNLEYLLDTSHGADYFRRWHSHVDQSGGLLVHKSTHHFDLVNWWIDSIPDQVFAYGKLAFYGRKNAEARGDSTLTTYDRYTGSASARDPFRFDLKDGALLEKLYFNAEAETGYRRDQNVFRDGIDVQDTMSVNVRYRTNVFLNYSLVCYSPREGMRVTFNGDRGRLEYYEFTGTHVIRGQTDAELAREQKHAPADAVESIRLFPHFQPSREIVAPAYVGSHGGADPVLQEQIFSAHPPRDPWHRAAGHEQGAASILVGIAARHSMAQNRPIDLSELLPLRPETTKLSELV